MFQTKSEIRQFIRKKTAQQLAAVSGVASSLSASEPLNPNQMEAGKRVAALLGADPIFTRAHTVALFASLPDEIPTQPIHEICCLQQKQVVFPLIRKKENILDFFPVITTANGKTPCLQRGAFGIAEPGTSVGQRAIRDVDLFLVPGLAFTAAGVRLGRGNGYYDRTLVQEHFRHVPRYALAFDWQILDYLPQESFDLAVQKIFTPARVIDCDRPGSNRERE